MTRTEAYLALTLLPNIGPIRVRRLLDSFGSPQDILKANRTTLRAVPGIGNEMADTVASWEERIDLEEEHRRIAEHDIELLTIEDESYPPLLREIHDPPFLLFLRGRIETRDVQSLAVVGSRRTSHYGKEQARRLSFQLARAGFTIISGLARGIDTAAHEAALAAKGRTIAVLGSGIGHVYPPENRALAEEIAENGAVLSEFPVLYVPDRQSFPLRNRIVSGMSRGILVVEAPARSGSLITANQALEQGRSVFAVPGPVDRPTSEGCNRLIQQGASLVCSARDVIEEMDAGLSALPLDFSGAEETVSAPAAAEVDLPSEQRALLDLLEEGEQTADQLGERAGLPSQLVSVALFQLEMRGRVKQLPGKYFAKLI